MTTSAGASSARWGSDLRQGVFERVVPVDACRQVGAFGHRDVHLERESTARGPGGAEQPCRVRPDCGADDARREIEQPRQLRQVEIGGRDVGRAGKHREGRGGGRRQAAREREPWQLLRIPLVEPGEALEVVHLQVLHHARIVDRLVPLAPGLIGREPVQRLCRGLHVGSLSLRSPRRAHVPRTPSRIPARSASPYGARPRWSSRGPRGRPGGPDLGGFRSMASSSVCTPWTLPVGSRHLQHDEEAFAWTPCPSPGWKTAPPRTGR